ncbi:hypothetical protein BGW38_000920 [Lunasporangiospora selenospora]|uniref:Major facilitator superfamily (MFS) profile domain-containing protein n=1 Tax=Lunasporangiospora selenospora TaxID=979761 RepID=A0A9P6FWC4_9FUNG|nr:hypothetical protein BGW38_000920 [Lunasporangiospora selenospora]
MSQAHIDNEDTIVRMPEFSKEAVEYTVPDNTTSSSPEKKPTRIEAIRESMKPALLYVVSTAQFLDIVNGASVAVALLPIAKDLKFTTSEAIWIINAYTIAFAGLLLISGRLGDLFGHRRVFLFGLFWFALWSLVVSFSTSPIMFVMARVLQGMGAANTVPSAMALIATNYPPGPARSKAFGVFGAFGGMGAVTGILLAGGLISSIGWPWIFRISSIAAFLLWPLGFLAIPVIPPKAEKPKIDFIGATMATLGVTGVVFYISSGVDYGWASAKTLPVFLISIALLFAFVFVESKVASPIMPLRVWKYRTFSASVILAFVQMAMMQGVIFYSNMVFQEVYGWSSIKTAVGFLVHSLLAVVVFTVMGRIMPRLRLKPLILVGLVLRCGTALMFSFVDENTPYMRLPFPAFVLHVFGIGFTMLPLQVTAVRDAENKDQGLVGAIYNTGLQLGAPFGLAVLNVIAISANGNEPSTGHGNPALMKGYRNAFYGIIAFGPAVASTKKAESKDLESGESATQEEQIVTVTAPENGEPVAFESDVSTISSKQEYSLEKKHQV